MNFKKTCFHCGKVFSYEVAYNNHINWRCQVCKKVFCKILLRRHQKNTPHTGEEQIIEPKKHNPLNRFLSVLGTEMK